MLDLNVDPPIDWDEIGECEGPAHELDYDMVWSDEDFFSKIFFCCTDPRQLLAVKISNFVPIQIKKMEMSRALIMVLLEVPLLSMKEATMLSMNECCP